eukprot:CAMPEP_0185837744 /NCGR_PEP_ID=MMETSP1353-20130828/11921_1 /TAXON_ID=1077150 /ORGANISM="Erythrolobus australicus, Strain CCMP3124" /LENGTH=73 /DNA_ID=CAMNT_0028536701 /DNA_START=51 /DNA_END=269 /DNA_ORIENTATION=+
MSALTEQPAAEVVRAFSRAEAAKASELVSSTAFSPKSRRRANVHEDRLEPLAGGELCGSCRGGGALVGEATGE